ncbi:MAG: M56 family metallopeptidase [Elainella sp. Prado103]|nr:M56 family metallopeptidase [Elainella sp. Prado103]
MHLDLLLLALGVAILVRVLAMRSGRTWQDRWQRTLGLFLFSPLLLGVTAWSVLNMGQHGQMLGVPVGQIGFLCALGLGAGAGGSLIWQVGQVWRSLRQLQQHPSIKIADQSAYLLEIDMPFAAQVGFWRSRLVVSRGLLDQFSPEQLAAVFAHEQAHAYYHDTFWFFWLNWLRQVTAWLPNTAALWQELLLLREMRADRWATQEVEALLVAESLLQMAKAPFVNPNLQLETACTAVAADLTRLEERIEALLSETPVPDRAFPWLWILLAWIPCLTIILHQ